MMTFRDFEEVPCERDSTKGDKDTTKRNDIEKSYETRNGDDIEESSSSSENSTTDHVVKEGHNGSNTTYNAVSDRVPAVSYSTGITAGVPAQNDTSVDVSTEETVEVNDHLWSALLKDALVEARQRLDERIDSIDTQLAEIANCETEFEQLVAQQLEAGHPMFVHARLNGQLAENLGAKAIKDALLQERLVLRGRAMYQDTAVIDMEGKKVKKKLSPIWDREFSKQMFEALRDDGTSDQQSETVKGVELGFSSRRRWLS